MSSFLLAFSIIILGLSACINAVPGSSEPVQENPPLMDTNSLGEIFEKLQSAHPSKIRLNNSQFINAKTVGTDSLLSIRLLLGVHNLADIEQFYNAQSRSLRQSPLGEPLTNPDQVRVASDLLPGEIWLDGFFRIEDLQALMALPTVFSLEAASTSLP
jgi:hypothetical protein